MVTISLNSEICFCYRSFHCKTFFVFRTIFLKRNISLNQKKTLVHWWNFRTRMQIACWLGSWSNLFCLREDDRVENDNRWKFLNENFTFFRWNLFAWDLRVDLRLSECLERFEALSMTALHNALFPRLKKLQKPTWKATKAPI